MRFELTRPCSECPFRRDITFHLAPGRAQDIVGAVFDDEKVFTCHKTLHLPELDQQHCAGVLIMYHSIEDWRSHKAFRMAAMLDIWNPEQMDWTAPVFPTREAMYERMQQLQVHPDVEGLV